MRAKVLISILFSSTVSFAAPIASINSLNKSLEEFDRLEESKKPKVVVAVIDTGVDKEHPDLKEKLWQNQGEMGLDSKGRDKRFNQIDDDGNGFVDDVHGWNFVENDNDIKDNHGHGSHISGIIVGKAKPQIARNTNLPIKLMVLKYFDPKMDYSKTVDFTVEAINYAVNNGADIINYSSGGETFSKKEERAIKKAEAKGVIFVAAAGNEGKDLDKEDFYPAKYKLKNIISVSAVDEKQKRLPSSNYGKQTLSFSAPGKDIVSTAIGGKYSKMSGTSQASAYISHLLASKMLELDTE